jgi:hypothetical protein
MTLRMKSYYSFISSELTNEEKRSVRTIETLLTEHGAYAVDFMAGIYALCEDVFFPDGSRFSIFQPVAIAAKFEAMKKSRPRGRSAFFQEPYSISGKQREV